MMIVLLFFALFSITGNVAKDQADLMRAPPARVVTDYRGLFEKSLGVGEVWDGVNSDYGSGRGYSILAAGNLERCVRHIARHDMTMLNFRFMNRSHHYVVQLTLEYCQLAIRTIEECTENNVGAEIVRRKIRLSGDHRYCMVTALEENGFDVDLLFESTIFFQTIRPGDRYPLKDVKRQLEEYGKRYTDKLKPYQITIEETKSADLSQRIETVKKEITNYFDIFCGHWRPHVSHIFNAKTILDDVRNYSSFVRNIFNKTCLIVFHRSAVAIRKVASDILMHVENMQSKIITWDCNSILEDEKYREYEANEKILKKKKEKVGHSLRKLFSKASLEPIVDEYELSLAELEGELKSKVHYSNFVRYYNIAANVMLYVSINEGNRILKGIIRVVQRNCDEKYEIALDLLRGLRSTLSVFKNYFDKMVFEILDIRRIDVTDDDQKKTFDKRVVRFMILLGDNDEARERRRTCSAFQSIPDTIDDEYRPADYRKGGKFDQFYFTKPLLHMAELYRFVRNDFL